MISLSLTLAAILLSISGLFMTRSATLAVPFTIFGLYVSSSIASILGLLFSPALREVFFFLTVSAVSALALSIFFATKTMPSKLSWLGVSAFVATVIGVQVATRRFGLGSVAFGDGQTILSVSEGLQNATENLLVSSQGLKRGFALPALQSFGPPGEYAAGFLPLIFLAALFITLRLYFELSTHRTVFIAVAAVTTVIVFSTEAILRHLYLMNSHATAWLLSALFLLMLLRYLRGELNSGDIVILLLAFSSIAFLRLDFILLFSPYILAFIFIATSEAKKLAYAALGSIALPAWLWMSFAVSDFPYFGNLGPTILAMIGFGVGSLLILWLGSQRKPTDLLRGNTLWVISGLFAFLIFSLTDTPQSLGAVFMNLFLGEGLWGFSALFFLIVALLSFMTKAVEESREFTKVAKKLLIATIAVYVFAKFLDGQDMWNIGSSWARVGFGDSLNRTLITWLPFFFLPLLRLFSTIFPESQNQRMVLKPQR